MTISRYERRGGVLAGCLVVLAVILILLIAGGVYAFMNWRTWMSDAMVQGTQEVLRESELSEEQQSQIMVHITALADDFEAGNVSLQEMGQILEQLAQSPVIPVAAVYGARKAYFDESGLTEEERANAELQMQRLARGVFEKDISMAELENAIDQIAVRTSEKNWQIREPEVVTDEDLREMIAKITTLADEKEIPAEPFEVDVAAEVKEAIDRGRGILPPEEPETLEDAKAPAELEDQVDSPEAPEGELEDTGGGG